MPRIRLRGPAFDERAARSAGLRVRRRPKVERAAVLPGAAHLIGPRAATGSQLHHARPPSHPTRAHHDPRSPAPRPSGRRAGRLRTRGAPRAGIENQSRLMAGQIETLQYENRQLKEQLRKFQEDVEFRLNGGQGRQGRARAAGAGPAPSTAAIRAPAAPASAATPSTRPRAPGAPRRADAARQHASPRRPCRPGTPSRRPRPRPAAARCREAGDRRRATRRRGRAARPATTSPSTCAPPARHRRDPGPAPPRRERRRHPDRRSAPRLRDRRRARTAPSSTSRPRWACASSSSRIRATTASPARPTGSARATWPAQPQPRGGRAVPEGLDRLRPLVPGARRDAEARRHAQRPGRPRAGLRDAGRAGPEIPAMPAPASARASRASRSAPAARA